MSSSTIVGVDPGLATTGYGIIKPRSNQPRKFQIVDKGTIRTDSGKPKSDRLATLYQELHQLINEVQPARVGVEEVFYSRNQKTAMMVSEARGVIVLACSSSIVTGYSPVEVKKTVAGYGKASKSQVKNMVMKLLLLDEFPEPDDAADALAVALCGGLEHHSALRKQTGENTII
ncbi:MAG: crossover junction endodeoxyribonuclease RuvC [Candidatus Acetothermia bacterium]